MNFTFRISLVIALGPLDEKETTKGADSNPFSLLFRILPVGLLKKYLEKYIFSLCYLN